jgi:hypothetical protein
MRTRPDAARIALFGRPRVHNHRTTKRTITSDWLTISGWSLANGDTAVVICDFGATADVGTGSFVTGNDTYCHAAAASYNVAAPAGYTPFNETALVAKIETQSVASDNNSGLPLMGFGN